MKKLTIIFLVLTGLLVSLVGCNKENQVIRLGSMPTYSSAIYAVGIEKGFFEDAGVEVDLTIFRSARDRDGAASAGELDGFMTDIMGAVNLNAKGFPFIITSREYEDFGLVAGSGVDTTSLDEAKVGISENTIVEFIVDTYISSNFNKVSIVAVPDRMGALLSGELEYGVFPQPFTGIILGQGGQLFLSSASKNLQPVVLVFDEEYIIKNEKSVEAFYEGYAKTVEYMQANNYDDYKEVLVNVGLATSENVDFFRLPLVEYGLNNVSESNYDAIIRWMLDKDLLEEEIKFEDIYTRKFVK